MKAHLEKLNIKSNWKEHKTPCSLCLVDWDTKVYKEEGLVPQSIGGCCTYIKDNIPSLTDGELPQFVEVVCASSMSMISTGLKKHAWRKNSVGQCDAILLPASDAEGDAVLFVETKYSIKEGSWKNYREDSLKQITDTIQELRNGECPLDERTLYGLISFPLLRTEVFGASMFNNSELAEIYSNYQLNLYVSNRVTYKDEHEIEVPKSIL